jgi:N-acetylmuramoyl-L-alanine amidase
MELTTRHHTLIRKLLPLLALALVLVAFSGCATRYGTGAGQFHTVVIDAGHGGDDQGARPVFGSTEKVLALDTAQRTAKLLRAKGFRVIETRTRDVFIPLQTRADIANRVNGSILVSIHYNWAPSRRPSGLETYYYSSRSMRLAANILKQIKSAYPTKDRGIKYARFHVLRENKRPAVLCELGFLSCRYDDSFVQKSDVRQRLAERIVAGIIAEQQGKNP